MAQVEVVCAGCGKMLPKLTVDDFYCGPPRVHGCCDVCFPAGNPVVHPPELVQEPTATDVPQAVVDDKLKKSKKAS